MTSLRTARLDLEPFDTHDVDELHELFTDTGVRRYLLDGELVPRGWVEDEVDTSRTRFEELECGLWAARLRGEAPIIGFVGYRPFFDPPELQLMYGFLPAYWGRGLATEAAAEALRYGFEDLGFEEVRAATDAPNEASKRVLERLGMVPWKHTDEGPAGTDYFQIDRPRWQEVRAGRSTGA